jgi:predicted AAA+ superfamily ATPase
MLSRHLESELDILLKEYPVVTILGPRQAGKTTLCRERLCGYDYSNLENPEVREWAQQDPKAFLSQFTGQVIIDEIQRVPELLSYIQVIVDDSKQTGQFVLTGSHQLKLREAVSQSLAGRTAILNLLPFSISEIKSHLTTEQGFEDHAFQGFLPRVHDKNLRPRTAYANYYETYVERDVRQLIHLKDVNLFEKLLKLMAGRAGQIIDYTSLSNDIGIDQKTIKQWLSILETSFVLYKLPPYYENFGKRLIKSPKYYFVETGLMVYLLGIKNSEQVQRDPLVGQIFENLVVGEFLKAKYNRGERSGLYYMRDSHGREVDLVVEDGPDLITVEIKSAQTFKMSQLKGLKAFKNVSPRIKSSVLVYNGTQMDLSDGYKAVNFKDIDELFD